MLNAAATVVTIASLLLQSTIPGIMLSAAQQTFSAIVQILSENMIMMAKEEYASYVQITPIKYPSFLYPQDVLKEVQKIINELREAKNAWRRYMELKRECDHCLFPLKCGPCHEMRRALDDTINHYNEMWRSLGRAHFLVNQDVITLYSKLKEVGFINCSGVVHGCGYKIGEIACGLQGKCDSYSYKKFWQLSSFFYNKNMYRRITGYIVFMQNVGDVCKFMKICDVGLQQLEKELSDLKKLAGDRWKNARVWREKLVKAGIPYCDSRYIGFLGKLREAERMVVGLEGKKKCEKQSIYYNYLLKMDDANALAEEIWEENNEELQKLRDLFERKVIRADPIIVKAIKRLAKGRNLCEQIQFYRRAINLLDDDYPYSERVAYAKKLIRFLEGQGLDVDYYKQVLEMYKSELNEQGITNLILELEEKVKDYEKLMQKKIRALEESGYVSQDEAAILLKDPIANGQKIKKLFDEAAKRAPEPSVECFKNVSYSKCFEQSTISYKCHVYNPSPKVKKVKILGKEYLIKPFEERDIEINEKVSNECNLQKRIDKVLGYVAYYSIRGDVNGFVKLCVDGDMIECNGYAEGDCCFFEKGNVKITYLSNSPLELKLKKNNSAWNINVTNRENYPIDDADIWIMSNKQPMNFDYDNGIIHIYDSFLPKETKRYTIVFNDNNTTLQVPPINYTPKLEWVDNLEGEEIPTVLNSTALFEEKESDVKKDSEIMDKKKDNGGKNGRGKEKVRKKGKGEDGKEGWFDYKIAWVGLAALVICVYFLRKEEPFSVKL